jgi:hypothetical protein
MNTPAGTTHTRGPRNRIGQRALCDAVIAPRHGCATARTGRDRRQRLTRWSLSSQTDLKMVPPPWVAVDGAVWPNRTIVVYGPRSGPKIL